VPADLVGAEEPDDDDDGGDGEGKDDPEGPADAGAAVFLPALAREPRVGMFELVAG